MKKCIQSWLMACSVLLLSNVAAMAQPGNCDPASLPNTAGSCQFPNIDFPNGGPDCYVCQIVGGTPTCVADDTFCENIAGGDTTNVCRIASCDPAATGRTGNPTGCEYFIDPSPAPIPQCFLCNDATAPFGNHCPNGACEPGLGETVASCSEDCLVPGITPTPLPTQADMNLACVPASITFDGPPFNAPNSGSCEDGNICTTDTCAGSSCTHTNNGCSLDVSDLCCPSTCNAPPAGGICGNDTTCDVDCKEIVCPIPTPTPTPIATPTPPPPPFNAFIEGSGCSLSALTGSSSALAWFASLGLLTAFGLGKRRR